MKRCRLLLALLLLSPWTYAADASLKLLDSYTVGDVVHLIVEATGTKAVALNGLQLTRASDGFVLPLWWSHGEPPVLAPGGRGRISFAARRPAQLDGVFVAQLGETTFEATLLHATAPDALLVTNALDLGKNVALFVQNNSDTTLPIESVSINEEALTLDSAHSVSAILPGETGVLMAARAPDAAPFAPDAAVLVGLATASETRYRHAYLFQLPLFRVREGEVTDAFICPTHRHGTFDACAQELLQLSRNGLGLLPEVHFCRNRLTEGLNALAQCVPRALVNAQGSNPERGANAAWRGLETVLTLARTRTQPGIFSAVIEPGSNFDGEPGLMTDAPVAPIAAEDLQQTVYLALAAGAKGLVFRTGTAPDPGYLAMVEALQKTLAAIAPWLATLEPVSLGAQSDRDGRQVSTLYAGPNSMLILSKPVAENVARAAAQEAITLRRPTWFSPKTLLEVGGTWKETPMQSEGDALRVVHATDGGPSMMLLHGE